MNFKEICQREDGMITPVTCILSHTLFNTTWNQDGPIIEIAYILHTQNPIPVRIPFDSLIPIIGRRAEKPRATE